MKVALKKDIEKLGKRGDIKEVADGYARNYLIPRGLVEMASAAVIKRTEKVRQARELAESKEKEKLAEVADKIAGQSIEIKAKVGADDKLFGSITNANIAQAIKAKTKTEIDKKLITLSEPIKKIGEYKVKVRFVDEVEAEVIVKVIAE
ncbi:50S ribosomal protein L9 [Patescibacteria group bacterium]|nr:50S ribosomal protein L9 [Patescibacteria group bacterium]